MVVSLPYNDSLTGRPKGRTYPNHNQNINIQEKPLKGRRTAKTQPTFKGFSYKHVAHAKSIFAKTETIPVSKAIKELENYIPKGINDGLDYVRSSIKPISEAQE